MIKNIIHSGRTFGVEIEMGAKNYRDIDKLRAFVGRGWRFEDDGSIRHAIENPVELVTPILCGREGEEKFVRVCDKLKEMGFNANNIACGVHVHLGAEEYKEKRQLVVMTEEEMELFFTSPRNRKSALKIAWVGERAVHFLTGRDKPLTSSYRKIAQMIFQGSLYYPNEDDGLSAVLLRGVKTIRGTELPLHSLHCLKWSEKERIRRKSREAADEIAKFAEGAKPSRGTPERVKYDARMERTRRMIEEAEDAERRAYSGAAIDKGGRYIVEVVDTSHTQNLLTLFLFYILYNRVFLGMLPYSRRFGNSYCMPISDTYTPEEILACKTQEDFESLWYKARDAGTVAQCKAEHYNDSRYQDVNFHSLFNRHGTVEIRSHGATIDSSKILLWTALHQLVLDSVANGVITTEHLKPLVNSRLGLEELAESMMGLLNAPMYLRKYITRLLNYYSDTKLI